MKRRLLIAAGFVVALAGAAAAFAWVMLAEPSGVRLDAIEGRVHALRARRPTRWEVAEGVRGPGGGNLVPTPEALSALEAALGRSPSELLQDEEGGSPMNRWKRLGSPPPAALVTRIRESEELHELLEGWGSGSYGAATGANGEQLDDAILWASARAWALDEGCLAAIVDAVRVAQAIEPVPRTVSDDLGPAGEALLLASIEPRLTECGASAPRSERTRVIAVLDRLHEERPTVVPAVWVLEELEDDASALVLLRDEELPRVSRAWWTAADTIVRRLDGVEDLLDEARPREELPDERLEALRRIRGEGAFELWLRNELPLMSAVLRTQSGQPLDDVVDSFGDPFEVVEAPGPDGVERMITSRNSFGCESSFDAMAALDVQRELTE